MIAHGFIDDKYRFAYMISEYSDLAEICLSGLLIHDFGGEMVAHNIGSPDNFQSLDDLRKAFQQRIAGGALNHLA